MTRNMTKTPVSYLRNGNVYSRKFPLLPYVTDEIAYIFENGQCHALACELHSILGWPVVALGTTRKVSHYGVISPENFVGHIQGFQACCFYRKTVTSPENATKYRRDWLKPHFELAKHYAPIVAEEILRQQSCSCSERSDVWWKTEKPAV